MDWEKFLYPENEKPLDRLVDGYSRTSVFRTIGFIGDSLSSGEFETVDPEGKKGYHDLYEYSWGQYIARKNGLKAYNFSRGGMTAKEYMESFAEERGFVDDCTFGGGVAEDGFGDRFLELAFLHILDFFPLLVIAGVITNFQHLAI